MMVVVILLHCVSQPNEHFSLVLRALILCCMCVDDCVVFLQLLVLM